MSKQTPSRRAVPTGQPQPPLGQVFDKVNSELKDLNVQNKVKLIRMIMGAHNLVGSVDAPFYRAQAQAPVVAQAPQSYSEVTAGVGSMSLGKRPSEGVVAGPPNPKRVAKDKPKQQVNPSEWKKDEKLLKLLQAQAKLEKDMKAAEKAIGLTPGGRPAKLPADHALKREWRELCSAIASRKDKLRPDRERKSGKSSKPESSKVSKKKPTDTGGEGSSAYPGYEAVCAYREEHGYPANWCGPVSKEAVDRGYYFCGLNTQFCFEGRSGEISHRGPLPTSKWWARSFYNRLKPGDRGLNGLAEDWTIWEFIPSDHHWAPDTMDQ